jgi:hypothetical protein
MLRRGRQIITGVPGTAPRRSGLACGDPLGWFWYEREGKGFAGKTICKYIILKGCRNLVRLLGPSRQDWVRDALRSLRSAQDDVGPLDDTPPLGMTFRFVSGCFVSGLGGEDSIGASLRVANGSGKTFERQGKPRL